MGQLCYPGATQTTRTLQLALSGATTAPIQQAPLSPGLICCSNEGSISTTLQLMAEQTNGSRHSQVAARKWLTHQFSPGMLRSRPNICSGPTLPQQAEGRDLLASYRHMTDRDSGKRWQTPIQAREKSAGSPQI